MADVITGALDAENCIKAAFRIIDADGNGKISQSELRQAVSDFGEEITQQQADDVINIIDKDGDKEINYEGKHSIDQKRSLMRGGGVGLFILAHEHTYTGLFWSGSGS